MPKIDTYEEMLARRARIFAYLSPEAMARQPPPPTEAEYLAILDRCTAQAILDRHAWASYALSHPETPVHA